MEQKNIQIIGAGPWGTALAIALSALHKVELYTRNEEKAKSINIRKFSSIYKDLTLPNNITAITSLNKRSEYIIIAIPSDSIIAFVENNFKTLAQSGNLIIASKGMNHEKLEFFSDSFQKLSLTPLFLSGPNFAHEVANGMTSYSNIAGDFFSAEKICQDLSTDKFKLEPLDDYRSAEIFGCYKNILAIYSGYVIACGMGENYRAAICSQGVYELKEICKVLGGFSGSIFSFAGIGDIMLTCFSEKSRNFQLGCRLALGETINPGGCIEGILSAKSLYKLLEKKGFKYKILSQVYELIESF